jgi:hypothetical protein
MSGEFVTNATPKGTPSFQELVERVRADVSRYKDSTKGNNEVTSPIVSSQTVPSSQGIVAQQTLTFPRVTETPQSVAPSQQLGVLNPTGTDSYRALIQRIVPPQYRNLSILHSEVIRKSGKKRSIQNISQSLIEFVKSSNPNIHMILYMGYKSWNLLNPLESLKQLEEWAIERGKLEGRDYRKIKPFIQQSEQLKEILPWCKELSSKFNVSKANWGHIPQILADEFRALTYSFRTAKPINVAMQWSKAAYTALSFKEASTYEIRLQKMMWEVLKKVDVRFNGDSSVWQTVITGHSFTEEDIIEYHMADEYDKFYEIDLCTASDENFSSVLKSSGILLNLMRGCHPRDLIQNGEFKQSMQSYNSDPSPTNPYKDKLKIIVQLMRVYTKNAVKLGYISEARPIQNIGNKEDLGVKDYFLATQRVNSTIRLLKDSLSGRVTSEVKSYGSTDQESYELSNFLFVERDGDIRELNEPFYSKYKGNKGPEFMKQEPVEDLSELNRGIDELDRI